MSEAVEASGPFRLQASLDLNSAEALRGALSERLSVGGAILIDAGAVERIGTPCLQLLAAAAAAARGAGLSFRVVAASEVLASAVRELGLSTAIPLEA